MSEVAREHPNQNIVDALELALRDVEFEPLLPDEEVRNELPIISSGSVRIKSAYDFEARDVVHVVEYLGWMEQDSEVGIEETRRLIVWWDNDTRSEEFDLDTQEIVFEEGEVETEQTKSVARLKLMQALRAVMTD